MHEKLEKERNPNQTVFHFYTKSKLIACHQINMEDKWIIISTLFICGDCCHIYLR